MVRRREARGQIPEAGRLETTHESLMPGAEKMSVMAFRLNASDRWLLASGI
jgi:hypothetical protein